MSDAVTLGYVHDTQVAYSWHDSVVNLLLFDAANNGRIMRGGYCAVRYGTGGIINARTKVAEAFLLQPADWLFIVDTDMGFRPETLEQLLAVADPVERPIVGALCFAWKETDEDGLSGFRCEPRPTIIDYVKTDDGHEFRGRPRYPVNMLVRCAATGSACVLIHRSVFEAITEKYGPQMWYERISLDDDHLLGEDVSFCVRAGACGFPVHVHTGIRTSHMKTAWVSETDYFDFELLADVKRPRPAVTRPAEPEPVETPA